MASSTSVLSWSSIADYTNLGPMTTPVTFPAECYTNLYDFQTPGIGVPYTYYTYGCALSTCCPSNSPYTTPFAWYSTYHSPAVCPSGYNGCPVVPGISTAPGETALWCCPSGYNCPYNPTSDLSWAQSANMFCQSTHISLTSAFVYDNTISQDLISQTPVTQYYWAAYPIQVRHQSSDLNPITSSTSHASSSPASSTNASTASASPSSRSGLSSGAIAGIAVGAIAAGLLALGAILYWCRRRYQKRREQPSGSNPMAYSPVDQGFSDSQYGHERDMQTRDFPPVTQELDASEESMARKGGEVPVELGGDDAGHRVELAATPVDVRDSPRGLL